MLASDKNTGCQQKIARQKLQPLCKLLQVEAAHTSLDSLRDKCEPIAAPGHPASEAFSRAVVEGANEEQQRLLDQRMQFLAGGISSAQFVSVEATRTPSPENLLESAFARMQEMAAHLTGCEQWAASARIAAVIAYGDPQRADGLFSDVIEGMKSLPIEHASQNSEKFDYVHFIRSLIDIAQIRAESKPTEAKEILRMAIQMTRALTSRFDQRKILTQIAILQAEEDPEQALSTFALIPDAQDPYFRKETNQALVAAVRAQAKTSFPEAVQIAEQISCSWNRVFAVEFLALEEIKEEIRQGGQPANVLARADNWPVDRQTEAYCAIAEVLRENLNIPGAECILQLASQRVLNSQRSPDQKTEDFRAIIKAASTANPGMAESILDSAPAAVIRSSYGFIKAQAYLHPDAAFEALASKKSYYQSRFGEWGSIAVLLNYSQALFDMVQIVAPVNPVKALEWTKQLEEKPVYLAVREIPIPEKDRGSWRASNKALSMQALEKEQFQKQASLKPQALCHIAEVVAADPSAPAAAIWDGIFSELLALKAERITPEEKVAYLGRFAQSIAKSLPLVS